MSKIIIAGAGIGGLGVAAELAKKGHDVTVYEKGTYSSLAYDWHDDMEEQVYDGGLLEKPDPSIYFKKRPWAFVSPFSVATTLVRQPEPDLDLSTRRTEFSQFLADRAIKAGAKIVYGVAVQAPIIKDGKLVGIKTDKGDFTADLIIDCLGAYSAIRTQVPAAWGIQNAVNEDEMFYVWRGFFDRKEGVPGDADGLTNKVYLKHLGNVGISWCIDDGHEVDILAGLVGGNTQEHVDTVIAELKKEHPFIGDKIVRAGGFYRIPVRRPLTLMVADNYAVIGDAAFMTIPLLGSGLASGIYASRILADAIENANGDYTAAKLYPYQVAVYKKFGAVHAGVDYIKNWLLNTECDRINKVMNSGLIAEKDLIKVSKGRMLFIPIGELLGKAAKGIKMPGILLELNDMLMKHHKAYKLGLKVPETYDLAVNAKWAAKLNNVFKK
ncbi:MAG: NAD(P)/FAD-dependent oxidoreductase [Christensenellaceae bacterium]|jgi:flavin-dependent dehydrogenase|nr:NAD(P)/FAD-dependent oxidoreductase [Christensenellaceae bacterium]